MNISASGLNLITECPRCCWLEHRGGIKRPRGIFPSLPGGMDRILKQHYDLYRGSLPPELKLLVPGVLHPDTALLNSLRNNRQGLSGTWGEVRLTGAIDDLLLEEGVIHVMDAKTRGWPPKPGDSEKYYGNQMNAYALLLQHAGYTVGPTAYLCYYHPDHVDASGLIDFTCTVVPIAVDPARTVALLEQFAMLLALEDTPPAALTCEYCAFALARAGRA